MKSSPGWLVAISAVLALLGCGGGGGGGSQLTFTDWAYVVNHLPETAILNGISREADYDADVIADHGVSTGSSVTIKYSGDGYIEQIDIKTPTSELTWDDALGEIDDSRALVIVSKDTELGIVFNPIKNPANPAWQYQTFGAWETGRGTGSGTIGAISAGVPTAGSAIPTTGEATFTGKTAGIYLDVDKDYITASDLTIDADFLNRKLIFTTTNTIDAATGDSLDKLDMFSDNLSYNPATNSFSDPSSLAASKAGLTGSTTGQFYGPQAQELGGVFSLSASDGQYYSGSYGAVRGEIK